MPTLDEIEVHCSYCEEQELYKHCLYRPPICSFKPRGRAGKVIWVVKDGKPVILSKPTERKERREDES